MCGIAGYIGRGPVDQRRIADTLALMTRRGPDHQGCVTLRHGEIHVVLLHARLSIIDLDDRANQPMSRGAGVLVFNGEIYNYVEVRAALQRRGVHFHTESDTEVLLQAYLTYGQDCLEHLEGMWSFALWDGRQARLLLSRDRFGEKPLYTHQSGDGLFFGSEVKLIRALSGRRFEPNWRQLQRQLVYGYRTLHRGTEHFFSDIVEVPYATVWCVGPDLGISRRRYWTPEHRPMDMSLDDAVATFRQRLHDSVGWRLRSDVPLAFCLSGGVDSAGLASIASKIHGADIATFSIVDPDPRYDESKNIRATVEDLGCPHTTITLRPTTSLQRLRRLVRYHDAPVYTISYYIHALLSEAIHHGGFRVAVSGTAADELVSGYYDHFNLHLYETRHHAVFPRNLEHWRQHVAPGVRNPHLQNPKLFFERPDCREHLFLGSERFAAYLKEDVAAPCEEYRFCSSLLRNRMLNELFHEVVPAILHEDDLNSMYYSVENRSPYLDSALFECAFSIPAVHLIREGYAKYVLRQALAGTLNETVRGDRRKVGFNAAIDSVFELRHPDVRSAFLDDGPIFDVVHKDAIETLLAQDAWPNSASKFLFNFINLRLFLEEHVDGAAQPRSNAGGPA